MINQPHDKYTDAYVDFLKTYTGQYEKSIKNKNGLKIAFFIVISLVMFILMIVFAVVLVETIKIFKLMIGTDYKSTELIVGAIVSLVSSFVTMNISIFKLPKFIAKYLFNKDEDSTVMKIISGIQLYELQADEHEKRMETAEKDIQGDKLEVEEDLKPHSVKEFPKSIQESEKVN